MTQAQMQAAVDAYAVSAAEFLAKKHGVTLDQIADALAAGDQSVADQMAELVHRAAVLVPAVLARLAA